tara:strand:- start:424 stop:1350 length:927 start_codon:yes stop_codon:yes gene_type:complete
VEDIASVEYGYPTLCAGVEKDTIETFLTEEDLLAKRTVRVFHRSVTSKVRPLERALNNYFKRFARKKLNTLRRNGTLRLFAGGSAAKLAKAEAVVLKALSREEEEAFVSLVLRYGDIARDEETNKIFKEYGLDEEVLPLIWPSKFYTAKRRILGETIRNLDAKAEGTIRDILATSTQATIRPTTSSLARDISNSLVGVTGVFGASETSRIANTEIPSFKNFGKHVAYAKAGVEKLRWVSIIDSRTRPAQEKVPRANHIMMDKRETDIGVPFDMAVSGAKMFYPGDPSGPPYEVINCRCTLLPIGKPKR